MLAMSNLYRFGISLEQSLIDAFDEHIQGENYQNRSEAIRDMIREKISTPKWGSDEPVAGAVIMTYDHHKRDLLAKLTDVQHDYQDSIISTQHVHLDHHHCLEIIAVRGKAREVEDLASKLKAFIGVKNLKLCISALGDQ
jgi:Predicted transcriptional regulators containing the CopG/Arc/MetJ DNA-binding domain and a metal-binding domain